VYTDYLIQTGGQIQAHGAFGSVLGERAFTPGAMRPFVHNGRPFTSVPVFNPQTGKMETKTQFAWNADATLLYDQWKKWDTQIMDFARQPMNAWADLRQQSQVRIANAMGTLVFMYQKRTSAMVADVSIDGDRETIRDRPVNNIDGIPLPIIHSDFWYGRREIEVAANGGPGLDTTGMEEASIAIGETIEKMTLGTWGSFGYAGFNIYGMTNFPARMTFTMTNPTAGGWVGQTLINELLTMRQNLTLANIFGPYTLYFSPAWDLYLDKDYYTTTVGATGETRTLRSRVREIRGFENHKTMERLTGFQVIIMQRSGLTARALVGLDPTPIQWSERGDMRRHFKIYAILVPQFRADAKNQCGLMHGVAP
jgi:hypothetical protein